MGLKQREQKNVCVYLHVTLRNVPSQTLSISSTCPAVCTSFNELLSSEYILSSFLVAVQIYTPTPQAYFLPVTGSIIIKSLSKDNGKYKEEIELIRDTTQAYSGLIYLSLKINLWVVLILVKQKQAGLAHYQIRHRFLPILQDAHKL